MSLLASFLRKNNIRVSQNGNISVDDLCDALRCGSSNILKGSFLSPEHCACVLDSLECSIDGHNDVRQDLGTCEPSQLKSFFDSSELVSEPDHSTDNPDLTNGFIYVISSNNLKVDNCYKIGRTKRSRSQLLSKYATYLLHPVLYSYQCTSNYVKTEQKILHDLDCVRLPNYCNPKSDWVQCNINTILETIAKHINIVPTSSAQLLQRCTPN